MIDSTYFSGFGGHFESEALTGALPQGRNSPKKSPYGLYPEQLNGSAFTMPRSENLRTWMYRIQPSVVHGAYQPSTHNGWMPYRASEGPTSPQQMRWQPAQKPTQPIDFLASLQAMVHTANPLGCSVLTYSFNSSMTDSFFYNADGEILIVPEMGAMTLNTEMGVIELEPQEIAVIPRGIKFQVQTSAPWCRGYLGENRGQPFRLPDLGPLGSNGLANPRDFKTPKAKFWNEDGVFRCFHKFDNGFWLTETPYHPLNVVAWHGNYAPYKYDLRKFNTMGTVSYDHPDPSIYTVLTSPSTVAGQANCDFVIFPPRWLVAEDTFRPPYFHRNFMNEFMGLIAGAYDAKEGGGFVPGGSSLHNSMSPHGPDSSTFEKAIAGAEAPQKVDKTMAFMFESCDIFHPSAFAKKTSLLDRDYHQCWQNLKKRFEE